MFEMPHELLLPASPPPHPVCLYECVRAGPSLINCCTEIKRSHFLLVTPATRVPGYASPLECGCRMDVCFHDLLSGLGGGASGEHCLFSDLFMDHLWYTSPTSMKELNELSGQRKMVCLIVLMIKVSYRDCCTVALTGTKPNENKTLASCWRADGWLHINHELCLQQYCTREKKTF